LEVTAFGCEPSAFSNQPSGFFVLRHLSFLTHPSSRITFMSGDSSSKQTLSFLMRRFKEAGIRPRTASGQSFLIDLNLLGILVDSAQLTADDVVLEIGTGTGSLTALMAPRAAAVVTVELDRRMFQLAAEELHALHNVAMLQTDALKNKNRVNPAVLEAIDARLNAAPGRRFKLVANLPYNIAAPVIGNLLAEERPPDTMTVTIQKELAERIIAAPGTKDYGALSVWIQSQCRAEILRALPPTVFWPRPKVHSAFVQIAYERRLRGRIGDREFFRSFVRAMFCHRRKFLRTQLLLAAPDRLDKSGADEILGRLKLNPELRAERLDVEAMIALSEAVRNRPAD
jgi:16S rRNA (adenine1518-N6/adenine1519-N6)-dimethyltransferase